MNLVTSFLKLLRHDPNASRRELDCNSDSNLDKLDAAIQALQGGGGGTSLQKYKASLAQADIAALNGTPFTVLPGSPSGKLWIPSFFLFKIHGVTAGWDVSAVTRFTIFGDGVIFGVQGAAALGSNLGSGLTPGEVRAVAGFPTALVGSSPATADSEYQVGGSMDSPPSPPLKLECEGGNPVGGDNTLSVTTYYVEEDFS